ncbi:PREDICTED: YLS9 [Prunus dulcis]|uniref:PREDICTED: YLS9 n=1 Tax=Prunus dulcis TaxID=3755 RepID=A0A5E4EA46_PRUDU|nr:PREDICTED: YLS9 [Prunus dulcis]
MPTLFCRHLIDGIVVFSVMSLVFFIAWLALQLRLPELWVDSASVFTLNDTRFELIATWDLTLLAADPYYDSIHALPYLDPRLPARQNFVAPFVLTKRNQTCIGFKL